MLALLFAACGCEVDPDESDDLARLAKMKQDILDLVEESTCEGLSDCTIIGIGAKPCGGSWEYVVYSKSSVDPGELKDLVMRYYEFNDVLNRRYGYASDCSLAPIPQVACVDGRCVASNGDTGE